MSKIFIIGHKSPDLDSVAGAIAYANFKNSLEKTDLYESSLAGEMNKESIHILDKLSISYPKILTDLKNKKIILIDHNESEQALSGIEEAEILEILDHHKLNFSYFEPIKVNIEPWGASCTIIADLYFKNNIHLEEKMAELLLSAILIDTVIGKSPTTTAKDREIIEKLASLAKIENWQNYGMSLFKIRSSVADLSPAEIIKADYKDFQLGAGKFGIGQVETADLKEIENKEDEILSELDKIRQAENYHTVMVFLTDIINEGSKFLVSSSDEDAIEKAFAGKLTKRRIYLPGVMSRKKQVAPLLSQFFDKN